MSMTREEAIKHLRNDWFMSLGGQLCVDEDKKDAFLEAVGMGIKALRPVSREQITKIWPGCDACEIPCNNCESIYAWDRYGKPQECTGCPENEYKNYTPESQFCEFCGKPLTDEAVEVMMESLEALHENNGCP